MTVPFLDLKTQFNQLQDELIPEVTDVLKSCHYIGGDYVSAFEREMESYLGVKHASGCANGTDALMLALKACGVGPGDEVITTAFSFFATAEAVAALGAVPVFVDIRESDYTLDPEQIENAVTERTKAILPVHIFGAACDMDSVMAVARKHGLRVIEDSAQAIGCEYKGKKAGTLGDIGCFSFYPTKNLGAAGDGGMLVTDQDDLAVIINAFKEHGAGKNGAEARRLLTGESDTPEAAGSKTELYDPFKYYNYLIGYNSRLDAIQAAILSVKLRHLEEYNRRRGDIAGKYNVGLTERLKKPCYPESVTPCWHQYVVLSEEKEALCEYLSQNGVGNGTFYPVPLHRQKAFHFGNCGNPSASLPVAESVSSRTVCLPIFPEMMEEQVEYVIRTVNGFYGE